MVIACGSSSGPEKSNDYASKSILHMNRMLDTVENDDFIAFREAAYSLYVLQNEASDEEIKSALPQMQEKKASIEARYNRNAYKFEKWSQRAKESFEADGVDYWD